MKVKQTMIGAAVVFVGVLAVIIGQRMSTDAMAVVIGVIFGVAASIPTSLLVVAVTPAGTGTRGGGGARGQRERMQPPVIVLNPGGSQGASWYSSYQSPALPSNLRSEPTRSFHMVGDEETMLEAQWRSGGSARPARYD